MSKTQNFQEKIMWEDEDDRSFDDVIVIDRAKTKDNRAQKLAPGMLFRTGSDQLINCKICGRHFHKDRVEKHETVCRNTYQRKREPFNSSKQLFGHLRKNYLKPREERLDSRSSSPSAVLDLYGLPKHRISTKSAKKF